MRNVAPKSLVDLHCGGKRPIFAPHQFAAVAYRSFFPHDSRGLFAFNHAIRSFADRRNATTRKE
jgi:hypothetical protein